MGVRIKSCPIPPDKVKMRSNKMSQKKKEVNHEKIIEAAVPIFMKKGYLGTSMREIATGLGVKAGSLYYHIRNKEELLEKIHDFLIDELLEKSQKIIDNGTINNTMKLKLFVKNLLKVMAQLRPYATVFFRDYRFLSPGYFQKVNKKRMKYRFLLEELIKNGIRQGEFRKVNPKIISLGIFGMFIWVHTWFNPKDSLKPDEIADIFCNTLLDGLNVGEKRSKPQRKNPVKKT
jgi:TetR/AcrR family transcriptional regulator, cholesterol catabolism regulator